MQGSKVYTQALTVTVEAYTAKDAVGAAFVLEGAAAGPTGRRLAVIESVTIMDKAAQDVDYELVVFNQAFTDVADGAAWDPSDADLFNIIGIVPVTNGLVFSDNGVVFANNVNLPIQSAEDDGDIHCKLYTIGTPTYASVSDVKVAISIRYE